MPRLVITISGKQTPVDLPPVPANLPAKLNDQPVFYAWKAMAAPGQYVHPKSGRKFELSRGDITEMSLTHRKLRDEIGFQPYVPIGHKGQSVGKVIDFAEREGVLLGLHQLVGEDARVAATRNESSVNLNTSWADQHGRNWKNVIDHNALVPNPVLTGLGGFVEVPIAASRDGGAADVEQIPVYALAREEPNMDLLTQLRTMLGLPETATEADVLAALKAKLEAKPSADVITASREYLDLKQQLKTANDAIALSRGKEVDGEILADRMDDVLAEADSRVTSGKWTAAQLNAFKAIVAPGGKPSSLMLSRDSDNALPARALMKLLDAPAAPAKGEKTKGQVIPLDRNAGGDDEAAELKAIEDRAKAYLK